MPRASVRPLRRRSQLVRARAETGRRIPGEILMQTTIPRPRSAALSLKRHLSVALALASIAACTYAPVAMEEGPVPSSPAHHVSAPAPTPAPEATPAATKLPENWQELAKELTLTDLVDLALANNTITRASWLAARSAAFNLGSERAAYFPTLELDADITRMKQSAVGSLFNFQHTTFGPSLTLNTCSSPSAAGPARRPRRGPASSPPTGSTTRPSRMWCWRSTRATITTWTPSRSWTRPSPTGGAPEGPARGQAPPRGRGGHGRRRAPGPDRGLPGRAQPPDHRRPAPDPARGSWPPPWACPRHLVRGRRAPRQRPHRAVWPWPWTT